MTNWKELVGKRVLVRKWLWSSTAEPDEYLVLEVSPSGDYVKFQNYVKNTFWVEKGGLRLVEVLDDILPELGIIKEEEEGGQDVVGKVQ